MLQKKIRCIDCVHPRLLTEDELKGQQSETIRCKIDGTSKTKYCIFAIKDCSRFDEGENPLQGKIECPQGEFHQCQTCGNLTKVPYLQSQSTHHENWECPKLSFSMQYEDTCALRPCPFHIPGKPKNRS